MNSICSAGRRLAAVSFLILSLARFLQAGESPFQEPLSSTLAQGIQLYREEKYKEAVGVLKSATKQQANNPEAWHYLGMAQIAVGDSKAATKSFRQAIKLRPDFAAPRIGLASLLVRAGKLRDAAHEAEQARINEPQNKDAHYIVAEVRLSEGNPKEALAAIDTAIKLDGNFQEAWLLKSLAWVGLFRKEVSEHRKNQDSKLSGRQDYDPYKHLKESAVSLEMYLNLNQSPAEKAFWNEQLETMRFYAKWSEGRKNSPKIQPMDISLRPTITYKERAQYTPEARAAGIVGAVEMMVVYQDDGQIKHILVLQGLSHGLTPQAVRAARRIKFIPAVKDGKPVSVVGRIEFNFSLY